MVLRNSQLKSSSIDFILYEEIFLVNICVKTQTTTEITFYNANPMIICDIWDVNQERFIFLIAHIQLFSEYCTQDTPCKKISKNDVFDFL